MKLSIYKPSESLQDIVKQYILIESLEDQENLWVLPNLGNYILFNPGLEAVLLEHSSDSVSHVLPKEFCLGIKSTQIVRLYVSETDTIRFPMFGVELYPTGYHRLFNHSAHELRKEHKPLQEALVHSSINFNELYALENVDTQISYIEKGLIHLKEESEISEGLSSKIEEIIAYILKNLENVNVKNLLDTFSYSRTSLERDFKKVVGYTPKEFIQTLSFYMLSKDLVDNGYDYNTLAYEYCDRSHMNRAFKKYSDVLPSKFQDYIQDNKINIYQQKKEQSRSDVSSLK